METPPPAALISASFRRPRSTSSFGRSTSSFIKSRRLVPPARNFACGFVATARTAAASSLARTYLNGRIPLLLSHARQLLLVDKAPRLRGLFARVDFFDRGKDARVSPATTDVAAHSFADLVIRKFSGVRAEIFGDMAHLAAFRFREQADRGANLPRRAVATLEAVILDERRLHRVELIVLGQPLDCRDLFAFAGRGQRQAGEDAPPVYEHRASTALALITSLLRAGQSESFAQRVQQHDPRIDLQLLRHAVHFERELDQIFRGLIREHRVRRGRERREELLLRQEVEGE